MIQRALPGLVSSSPSSPQASLPGRPKRLPRHSPPFPALGHALRLPSSICPTSHRRHLLREVLSGYTLARFSLGHPLPLLSTPLHFTWYFFLSLWLSVSQTRLKIPWRQGGTARLSSPLHTIMYVVHAWQLFLEWRNLWTPRPHPAECLSRWLWVQCLRSSQVKN